jgi:hypothetical protein
VTKKRSAPTSETRKIADQQLDQLELKISASQIQSIVPKSLKTAFGGSPSNLQLCWRLLARSPSRSNRRDGVSFSEEGGGAQWIRPGYAQSYQIHTAWRAVPDDDEHYVYAMLPKRPPQFTDIDGGL